MTEAALTAASGAIFGAALTASNVFPPSVIISQLELRDFHMLNVFLSATAASAAVIVLLERFGVAKCQPRSASTTGRFGPYDANLLGGSLIGVGMALTGACPGTVFAQLGTGVKSAIPTFAGAVTGGILFARYGSSLRQEAPTSQAVQKPETLSTKFELNPNLVLWLFELACVLVVGVSTSLGPTESGSLLHPVAGGAAIGLAQGASLLLTGRALGVSAAYDEIGRYFWFALDSSKNSRPPTRSTIFALGLATGAFVLSKAAGITAEPSQISAFRAFIGGCTMVFGARLAGGCTSGHGISGMSTFSIASIISVAAMFGGGIAAASLVALV